MDPVAGAKFLGVLADGTRIQILQLLAGGELAVAQVSDALAIPHYQASRHLSALKSVGLVEGRRDKRRVLYQLTPAGREGHVDLGCCTVEFSRT
ncbi:MAG: metalloregulator ArsR/SmtB family transcription factor [Myxococcota bacterium]